MRITICPYDTCQAMRVDTQEGMWVTRAPHRVNSDSYTSSSSVLEPYRERRSACQFSMKLGFGGTCADSTPGDGIGEELRRNGIEKLASDRDTSAC